MVLASVSRRMRWCLSLALLGGLLLGPMRVEGQDSEVDESTGASISAEQLRFFEAKIRPILVEHCYECHAAESDEIGGELTVDTRAGLLRGGERGPAVVPGNPRRGVLLEALRHVDNDLAMPPDQKLPRQVIADFEQWIEMGAPDPREGDAVVVDHYAIDLERGREFWSFQPPRAVAAPEVTHEAWPRTEVDRYLLAAMEAKQLEPVADAAPRVLLRRLSFDLIGLPPTAAEVADFEQAYAADAETAIARTVDRLLDSPRFGEKWARHWLDVARFAESTGSTVNFYYPQAWRYRDYVIAAFNDDLPYDQFILEQLAGDLLESESPELQARRTVATGFLALGPKTLNERSGLKFELDVADEQIDVTTQAFLGLTVACARCHDHKFDPIPQVDYYALAGIFRSTETCYGTVSFINAQRVSPLIELPADAELARVDQRLSSREREQLQDQIDSTRESMSSTQDPLQRFFASGRVSLLQAKLDSYDEDGSPRMLAMGVRDKPAARRFGGPGRRFGGGGGFTYDGSRSIGDSPVYLRGEHERPAEDSVPRGTLQVMVSTPLDMPRQSSGRLELARWIASRDNPLTARVMVNRLWLQLYGRGLVPTVDDFGAAGQAPTHPELLDHLALEFVARDWSVKQMIRYLVTSRAYRLGSATSEAGQRVDPDNRLQWRMSPRRLDAELLRDGMLAVSQQLDVDPPVGSAVGSAGEGPVNQSFVLRNSVTRAINDPENVYRSIYLPIVRDNLPESLGLFDGADPALITVERPQTTVASQGLFLLNNEFVMRAADATAELTQDEESDESRVVRVFELVFARQPSAAEVQSATDFLTAYRAQVGTGRGGSTRRENEVWSAFCQALLVSAEFQFRL